MTLASVSPGRVGEFDAVVLENRWLRAVIVPSLGGRVWELEDRVRGRQWIWHRPDVPLTASSIGAVYDEVWAGGWEELFPNDAPGPFEGRDLPDHGEWWTLPWTVKQSPGVSTAHVRLTATASVVRATCTKEFRLESEAPTISVSYRIRSEEAKPFHFLFKQHLPIHLTAGCRLLVPGGRVEAVDPAFGTVLPTPGPFDWPLAADETGEVTDLRIVPPPSAHAREFVYLSGMPALWCGVADPERGAALHMSFDGSLPFLWLFLSYGGWRGTYTAVLEPCTNMPKDLDEAVRRGQSARLDPGQEFVSTVTVRLNGILETDK